MLPDYCLRLWTVQRLAHPCGGGTTTILLCLPLSPARSSSWNAVSAGWWQLTEAAHTLQSAASLRCRDCAALASNGELKLSELVRYKTQYIDAIYKAITAKPAYKAIRIVAIVEPDSL